MKKIKGAAFLNNQSGFSLIEMIVTIIVAIIVGIGLVLAWPGREVSLPSLTDTLAQNLRYARNLASSEETVYQVVFDPSAPEYTLQDKDGTDVEFPTGSATVTLDSGIGMTLTEMPNQRIVFNKAGQPETDTSGTALENYAKVDMQWEGAVEGVRISPENGAISRTSTSLPPDPQPSPVPTPTPTPSPGPSPTPAPSPTPTPTPSPSPSGDNQPPSQPAPSTTNVTMSAIAVEWPASTDNETASSNIIYNILLDGSPVTTTVNTSYTYTGLEYDTSYQIGVEAVDEAGNTSNPGTLTVSTEAPTCNVSLNVSDYGNNFQAEITVENKTADPIQDWSAVWSGFNYTLTSYWGGVDASTAGNSLVVMPLNENWADDTLAANGGTHTFNIQADGSYQQPSTYTLDGNACLINGSVSPGGSGGNDYEPPTTPQLSLVSKTMTDISVSWTTSSDNQTASSDILYNLFLDGSFVTLTNNTNYTFNDLDLNTAYQIEVNAQDEAGNTSSKDSLAVTTNDLDGPYCDWTYSGSYSYSQWWASASIDLTVINNAPVAISGWSIQLALPGITQLRWTSGGNYTLNGNTVTITNAGWNSDIAANGGQSSGISFALEPDQDYGSLAGMMSQATLSINGHSCQPQ